MAKLIISFLIISCIEISANKISPITLQEDTESSSEPAEIEPQDQPSESSVCPKYTCLEENVDTCLTSSAASYNLGDCKDDFYCPSFSLSSPPESVECVKEDPDYEPPTMTCVAYSHKNEVCNQTNPCHPDFYCKEGLICVERVSNGDTCTYLDECEIGNVCNKGICIEYFSVDAGKPADSKLACSSAIVSDGVCSVPSATISDELPKKCHSDDDCKATDETSGECVCVPNSRGDRYCKLHDSDEPVKDYLAAVNDGRIERSRYLLYYELNFPVIEKAESCYFKDAEELIKFKQLKKWANKCSASYLVVIGLLINLF
ncbi:unnamed protein product [Blepharisma stoltei]|uniref:Uncharacterized protein n=1 Tax=Blepharisma stoltei TaxID=1481888 RepID=A0AAU9J2W0_9CILI|nr:unnamed protein product [Blepharisma stoltei]